MVSVNMFKNYINKWREHLKKPKINIQVAFFQGMLFNALTVMLIQDWYGLEKYLEVAKEKWVNIPWWVWVPFIFAVLTWHGITLYRFEKLTTWMMIKTGGPKEDEEVSPHKLRRL